MIGLGSVLNALSALAALDYNQKKFYSAHAIKIIQRNIGVQQSGAWDLASVGAAADWQRSVMRLRPLTADGMFGPTTLGILIEELMINGRYKDAEYLGQYKHKNKFGQIVQKELGDSDKPVYAFFQYGGTPLDIRADPANVGRWMMKGNFRVEVYLDRQIERPERYEYRQFIKGRVFVHDGYFGDAVNKTHWQPRAGTIEQEQNDYSRVPGGLDRHYYTEDGETQSDGTTVEKFGYRSSPIKWDVGIIDAYSNDQKGHEYRLMDTFGIEGPRKADPAGGFKSGLKVGVELHYRGIVIKDGKMPSKLEINAPNFRDYCVAGKQWTYSGVKYVTW